MVALAEPLLEPGDLGLRVEADSHAGLGDHELLLLLLFRLLLLLQ